MQRSVKFGLASCVTLALLAVPQMADAQSPKSQACGVIVHKERVPGGVSKTPWFVQAKGMACTQAKMVAKEVAKAYAKSPEKRLKVSSWSCVDRSGWVVPGQYGQSRIVCKKSGSSVTLSWGA